MDESWMKVMTCKPGLTPEKLTIHQACTHKRAPDKSASQKRPFYTVISAPVKCTPMQNV